MTPDFRASLSRWHAAAIAAVQGKRVFKDFARVEGDVLIFERGDRRIRFSLPQRGGRLRIVGLGKAALGMARGVRAVLQAAKREVDDGLLIVRDRPLAINEREPWEIVIGNHPYPGEDSERAARRLLEFIGEPRAEDRVVVLLSGGASALCALPAPGVTLEDKRRATQALMNSGASIAEINGLRQQLSAIKGGRLAAHFAPADFVTFAISDVPDDDPLVIGSAPTWSEALANRGASYGVIATLDDALEAAALVARADGFDVVSLGRSLYGSVEQETTRIITALEQRLNDRSHDRPCVLIAGGEPLVRVKGPGRGGRAQELALRLGRALSASAICGVSGPITGLVAGTDGSDGPTDAAGAFFDGTVVARATAQGFDLDHVLETNDAGSALETLGDLWVTGSTGTNVADMLMVVIPGAKKLPSFRLR